MYVLIFWVDYDTKSIVEESDLCPNTEEGETTLVKYKDNKCNMQVSLNFDIITETVNIKKNLEHVRVFTNT